MEAKLLALIYLFVCAQAHFFLVTPTPRNTDSGIKIYPCGNDGFGTGPITTIAPGNYTVIWQETISHIGAPYVIALSYYDDQHTLILVDQIPFNPNGSVPGPNLKIYGFNINIPDIDCPRCALHMYNPMVDKIPVNTSCPYPFGNKICFSVYHSCADIVITGKNSVDSFVNGYSFSFPSCWQKNPPVVSGIYSRIQGQYSIDSNISFLDYQASFNCAETMPTYRYIYTTGPSPIIIAAIMVPIAVIIITIGIIYLYKKRKQYAVGYTAFK
jgi:hypothetical protein